MAVSCSTGPCVRVYTDPLTNQVIISAQRNTPGSSPVPKLERTHSPRVQPKTVKIVKKVKPVVKILPKPRPRATTWIPYKSRPVLHPTYHSITTKAKKNIPVITQVATAAISLSDQVSRLLPGSKLMYQPSVDPIAGIPIYFWSDSNPVFEIATAILGIGVSVTLQPSFLWDFGDGHRLTTSSPGGAFPDSTVTHSYKEPGNYAVALTISWAGSWSTAGEVLPVLGGAIVQTISTNVLVSPGPTNYTA